MRHRTDIAQCPRCGIWRCIRAGRPVTVLCRDCRAVLNAHEREAWAA